MELNSQSGSHTDERDVLEEEPPDPIPEELQLSLKKAEEKGYWTNSEREFFGDQLKEVPLAEREQMIRQQISLLRTEEKEYKAVCEQLFLMYGKPLSPEGEEWIEYYLTLPSEQRLKERKKLRSFHKSSQAVLAYCSKYEQRAHAYARQGLFDQATALIRKLAKRCEVFVTLPVFYQKQQDYNLALDRLEGDALRKKFLLRIRSQLGQALHLGNHEDAERLLPDYLFLAQSFLHWQSDGNGGLVARKNLPAAFQLFVDEAQIIQKNLAALHTEQEQQHRKWTQTDTEIQKGRKDILADDYRAQIAADLYTKMKWGDSKRQEVQEQQRDEQEKQQVDATQKNRVGDEVKEQQASSSNEAKVVQINEREQTLRDDDARDILREDNVQAEIYRPEERGAGVRQVAEQGLSGADRVTEMFILAQEDRIRNQFSGEAKQMELQRLSKEKQRGGRMANTRGALWKVWKWSERNRGGSKMITGDLQENRTTMGKIITLSTAQDDAALKKERQTEQNLHIERELQQLERLHGLTAA